MTTAVKNIFLTSSHERKPSTMFDKTLYKLCAPQVQMLIDKVAEKPHYFLEDDPASGSEPNSWARIVQAGVFTLVERVAIEQVKRKVLRQLTLNSILEKTISGVPTTRERIADVDNGIQGITLETPRAVLFSGLIPATTLPPVTSTITFKSASRLNF